MIGLASRRVKLTLSSVAVLTIAAATIFLLMDRGSRGYAERSLILKASNWNEVKAYQYEKTPGLERAEKLGLARQIGQVADIAYAGTSVRFDEVWYNSDHVYIFYSLTMDSLPKEDDQVPQMSLQASVEGAVPDSQQPFTLNWSPWEGVYYQGRLYGRLTVSPFGKDGEPLNRVDRLVLSKIALRRGGEDVGAASAPVALDINYDAADERSEIIPLAQTYEAMNRKIELVRLEMGTSANRLFFRYGGKDTESIYRADAVLRSDKGEAYNGSLAWPPKDGVYEMDFEPFNKRPDSIEIEWKNTFAFDRNLRFEFKLDAAKVLAEASKQKEDWRTKTSEPIDRLLNTEILLDELFYDERGLLFSIRYAPESPTAKPYLRLFPETPNSLSKELTGKDRDKWLQEMAEIIRVTNENGEEGEIGQRGGGPGNTFSAFIDKAFGDRSKEITVTVSNLITEWTIDWETFVAVPSAEE